MTAPPDLNADHLDTLAALACYDLLTVDQMQRVGIAGGRRRVIEAATRLLIRKHLVARKDAQPLRYNDHLPAIHWLTERGAEHIGMGAGSRRSFDSPREARHRLAVVEVHIALRAWAVSAGAVVEVFMPDFAPGRSTGPHATTLSYGAHDFSPDALVQVQLSDGKTRRLALEVERGGDRGDRTAFRKGLAHWRGVAEDRVMENRLAGDGLARFLMVFQTAELRRKALIDWGDPDAAVWRQFFCKGLDELGPDFNAEWHAPGRQSRPLFQLPA